MRNDLFKTFGANIKPYPLIVEFQKQKAPQVKLEGLKIIF